MDLREVIAGRTAQEQNLANPQRVTVTHKAGFYRSIILDVLSIGFAALFGYSYYRYLTGGLSVWILLLVLAVFGVISALQAFLTKAMARRLLVLLGEVLALFVFFRKDDWHILLATGVLMFFFLAWGYFASRSLVGNSIEIPFFAAANNVLGKFTTAALIFMILAYVPQIGGNNIFISQQNFRVLFDWASGLIKEFYPDVSLNGTLGDFAASVAKMELANNQNFQNLNPQAQNAAVGQAASQFTSSFAKNASSSNITAASSTSDAFYGLIVGLLNAWKSQSSGWFVVGWAVVLFFLLRGVGIIFVWIEEFLTLIVYEILLAAGFMKITEQSETRELLDY